MTFDLADFSYSRQRPESRPTQKISHFTIRVKDRVIGLPVDCVKTVFHLDRLTPVPLAPREVAGLANLRGRIVTALHLDRCLRIDKGAPSSNPVAVGVTHNGEDYALLVDDMGDVIVSDEADRVEGPSHAEGHIMTLMSGCYRYDQGFLSIIDVGALIKSVSLQSETANRSGISEKSARGADR